MRYLIGLVVICIPVLALATGSESLTPDDAINGVVSAFKTGKWGIGVGLLLLLLTQAIKFVAELFNAEIDSKYHAWIAAFLGVAAAVGVSLSSGVVWWEAVIGGVFCGAAAGGLWSLVAKHLQKKAPEKAASKGHADF